MCFPEVSKAFLKLIDGAHVFTSNYTQRALDELGLSYEALKAQTSKFSSLLWPSISKEGSQKPTGTPPQK